MAVRRDSFCSEALALIPEDEIEVGELIGAGSYGMVFKGHYHGALVALKQLIAERTDPTRAVTEYSDVRCVCVRMCVVLCPAPTHDAVATPTSCSKRRRC